MLKTLNKWMLVGVLALLPWGGQAFAEVEPPGDGERDGLPPLRIFDWEDEDGPPKRERRQRRHYEGRGRGFQREGRRRGRPSEDRPHSREEMREFREKAVRFVKEHFPERHEEMMALRERSPHEFRRRMMEVLPKVKELMMLMDHNPELGELVIEERQIQFEVEKSARLYSETDDRSTRDAIRRDIRDLAEEMHEVRVEIAEHKIEQLEKRLERVKTRLDRDRSSKDQRIERFMRELGVEKE